MWRALLVAALAVLGGCAGVGTQEATETLTPAPVPEPATPVSVPQRGGAVDVDAVIEGHAAVLAERSFHRRVERDGATVQDVWVDRDAGVVRLRYRSGAETTDIVVTEDTEYRYVTDGSGAPGYAEYRHGGDVPYALSLSGDVVLRQYVGRHEYQTLGTVRRDGRALAALRFNASDVPVPENRAIDVDSWLYVDRDGVVRYADHREQFDDGSELRLEMTVTDVRRVPVPDWLEADRVYEDDEGEGSEGTPPATQSRP